MTLRSHGSPHAEAMRLPVGRQGGQVNRACRACLADSRLYFA